MSLGAGPIVFEQAWVLALAVPAVLLVAWIARRNLSGLGGLTRAVAIAVRLIVVLGLIAAAADPQYKQQSDDVSVTVVMDTSRSVPLSEQQRVEAYIAEAAQGKLADDRLGVVSAAEDAYLQSLPSRRVTGVDRQFTGSPNGTNLGEALQLALAVAPPDAANRLVIASDGNETAGSLLRAAEAAKAAGVPVDVLPLTYRYDREVRVDRLIAPATARVGQAINLRPVLTASRPTTGRLSVLRNGEPLRIGAGGAAFAEVELDAGANVLSVPVDAGLGGPEEYEVVFESTDGRDTIVENNRALSVVFVSGRGRLLILTDSTEDAQPIVRSLRGTEYEIDVRGAEDAPATLVEFNRYDAVVMINQAAYDYSERQQEELKRYVHDSGGGLIMIGGPQAFGAGGWIGSPVEEALPVRLDPPQRRQMPRGALVIIVHSVEMPRGVYYGKQTAQAAVDALSARDLVGIHEFDPMAGATWVYPLSEKGNGSGVSRAIQNLTFGDMQSFDASYRDALQALRDADAGQKHMIVISDGDPSGPSRNLIDGFIDEQISVTTVMFAGHGSNADKQRMSLVAAATGGRFYDVPVGMISQLPQVFIKEAQVIKRALIWEGEPIVPSVIPIGADPMRGVGGVPPVSGYIVTAEREGLALTTLRGNEGDPISAIWQHGLGRVVAFTSDAGGRWANAWPSWDGYEAFWSQHIRWAMRPSGSADVRVVTESDDERTRVLVEAYTPGGERLPFARFNGQVARPDGTSSELSLRQIGPGRWEGSFESTDPGAYSVGLGYTVPAGDGEDEIRGSAVAAVTRPFAAEYRALEDNSALLVQVAQATGGRVLPADDPAQAGLWSRDGLEMPAPPTAVWIAVAIATLGLFLLDVAVRRVRIDLAAIGSSFAAAFSSKDEKAGSGMDALAAARKRAKGQLDERGKGGEVGGKAAASTKFEATEEQLRSSPEPTSTAAPIETRVRAKPEAAKNDDEEGMSRLLRAKKRAQDDFNAGQQGPGKDGE